jgi:hypothetical protein
MACLKQIYCKTFLWYFCSTHTVSKWRVSIFKLESIVVVWWLDLQLPVQSVPITTTVVSMNVVSRREKFKSSLKYGWFMMFNATFNTISAISWRSVLLVEETGVPGEKHRPVASHWQTISHYHKIILETPTMLYSIDKLQWIMNGISSTIQHRCSYTI